MTRKNEDSAARIADIEAMIISGVLNIDIAHKTKLTKGRISQIRETLRKRIKKENEAPIFYFEYIDHAVYDNGANALNKPTLACLGQVVKEDSDSLYVRQIWSISQHKDVRFHVIVKSTIKNQVPLVPKRGHKLEMHDLV